MPFIYYAVSEGLTPRVALQRDAVAEVKQGLLRTMIACGEWSDEGTDFTARRPATSRPSAPLRARARSLPPS